MFFGEHYGISIFNEESSEVLGRMDIEGVSELQAYYMAKQMLQLYKGNCWGIFHIFKDGKAPTMKVINKGDNNGKSRSN